MIEICWKFAWFNIYVKIFNLENPFGNFNSKFHSPDLNKDDTTYTIN